MHAFRVGEYGDVETINQDEQMDLLADYQQWLPDADFDDLHHDKTGLWYEITSKGFVEWTRYLSEEERRDISTWRIKDDVSQAELTISVAHPDDLDQALKSWREINPGKKVEDEPSHVQEGVSYHIDRGFYIEDGYRFVFSYSTSKLSDPKNS